ncbi:hypothetical protein ACFSTD_03845 [Novosphingobium colocasiae]
MAERPETPQDPIAPPKPSTPNRKTPKLRRRRWPRKAWAAAPGRASKTAKKPGGGITDEGDTPDLVDHMKHMDSSGVIDMFAYRGEETMDDLENRYGRAGVVDEDFANDDS